MQIPIWADDGSPWEPGHSLPPLLGRESEKPTSPRRRDSNVISVTNRNGNFVFLLGGGVEIQNDSGQSVGQRIEIRDPPREDNVGDEYVRRRGALILTEEFTNADYCGCMPDVRVLLQSLLNRQQRGKRDRVCKSLREIWKSQGSGQD